MKQADLHRAVARVTGETVCQIAQRGFSLLVMPGPTKGGCKQYRRCRSAATRARRASSGFPVPACRPA